jgi:hypothetical protein
MKRSVSVAAVLATLAATVTVAFTTAAAPASVPKPVSKPVPKAAPKVAAKPAVATKAVDYRGYQVRVPSTWPVVDLAKHPDACVRFDVHAVYLGHPTGQANCPAHLLGRTDALLIEPLDKSGDRLVDHFTQVAPKGSAAGPAKGVAGAPAGRLRLEVPSAGVIATASYGTDATAVHRILASGRIGSGAKAVAPVAVPKPAAAAQPATVLRSAAVQALTATTTVAAQPGSYTGEGFDPCAAPSASQMTAWGASPYRAIGVYIAGVSAACAQPNLTSSWVSTQTAAGWHIIPISVDLQAPCSTFSHRVSSTLSTATSQGTATADAAVSAAAALGLPAGSVLYDDMEAYDTTNTSCSAAVLTFLSAWTVELHAQGYLSGVYSSAASGMEDLAAQYNTGTYTLPDNIWFALWNGSADTNTGTYVPATEWANHQRLHQYSGDTDETWGGVTINVDDDYLDVGGAGAPTGCSTNVFFSSYTALSSSSTGSLVSAAQCLLTHQGYFTGSVNGTYGTDTAAAVSAFQTAKALPVTGTVNSHTWTALLAAGSQPSLENGSTGVDVERLQSALTAALGQTITIDGDFGSGTEAAVKSYQTAAGLSSDGEVGPLTWTALQAGK